MKLVATQIEKLPEGQHGDGGGLFLHVRGGSRGWNYRYQMNGKRRTMSLGGYPGMSLKKARMARDDAAELRAQGVDPIEARAPRVEMQTVEEAILKTHAALEPGLRPGGRWMSALKCHVNPMIAAVLARFPNAKVVNVRPHKGHKRLLCKACLAAGHDPRVDGR